MGLFFIKNPIKLQGMLGAMGLFSVGMAFTASIGVCSLLGIPYGPVHTSLPFLLMGLGVDDMFVMMACWRKLQLDPVKRAEEIPNRMGLMLKASGASITVTSFTDILAFAIGSITVRFSISKKIIFFTNFACFYFSGPTINPILLLICRVWCIVDMDHGPHIFCSDIHAGRTSHSGQP